MSEIKYAIVASDAYSTVQHFEGRLRDSSDRGVSHVRSMPASRVLTIEHETDGWFLYRWDSDGSVVNDTKHSSEADALEQARYEFGLSVGEWIGVPDTVGEDSLEEFILSIVASL